MPYTDRFKGMSLSVNGVAVGILDIAPGIHAVWGEFENRLRGPDGKPYGSGHQQVWFDSLKEAGQAPPELDFEDSPHEHPIGPLFEIVSSSFGERAAHYVFPKGDSWGVSVGYAEMEVSIIQAYQGESRSPRLTVQFDSWHPTLSDIRDWVHRFRAARTPEAGLPMFEGVATYVATLGERGNSVIIRGHGASQITPFLDSTFPIYNGPLTLTEDQTAALREIEQRLADQAAAANTTPRNRKERRRGRDTQPVPPFPTKRQR